MTPAQSMNQLCFGFISARAVYAAAKLGIADQIRDGAKKADELAQNMAVNSDALFRVMRLLAAIGVLEQSETGQFSLTQLGDTLRSDSPQSVRDYVILQHELTFPAFLNVLDVVRTGKSAHLKTFGKPVFELIQSDEEFAKMFYRGLASRAKIDVATIIDAYDFSYSKKVADIGGGNGGLLSAILSHNVQLFGVLFDIAPAIEEARAGRGGPLPRCQFIAGDFFEHVPACADTYLLKLVLHDWGNDDACRILKRCRDAMRSGDRLLVIEGLIGSPNKLTLTNFVDLTMMTAYSGRERTEGEFAALLEQSSLKLRRTISTSSALQILEAVPA
jgi:O-methyltransferase domain/Dimerisation domain